MMTAEQTQYLADLQARAEQDATPTAGAAVVKWYESQRRAPNVLTLLTMLAHAVEDATRE